jgi:L-threonylcarbamoyladenylate synthase
MKTIVVRPDEVAADLIAGAVEVLEQGGLVCLPTPSGYKLAADLGSRQAINAMIQAKRQVKNTPSLVLVPDEDAACEVVAEVSADGRKLMRAFWPGSVTLLFHASEALPAKIRKSLTRAKGWLGVRVPNDKVSLDLVRSFGRPVLVSSANLSRKHGARSVAQVRKNFGRTVALMFDVGDIPESPKSTLIDMTGQRPSVIRAGMVGEEDVFSALG